MHVCVCGSGKCASCHTADEAGDDGVVCVNSCCVCQQAFVHLVMLQMMMVKVMMLSVSTGVC